MMKSKMAVAIVTTLALGYGSVHAQSAPAEGAQQSATQAPNASKAKKLKAVTVTGSLIPQTEIETATPIVTITAQEMKAKGFTTIAQALQQSSFANGSVQGMQDTNSFTTGAETLSMFGLPVGFVKYLVDGRPMGNFPGLYNGSDTFNSLSGIPMDMVDHIDILPGGQSSLYGSDAIAGVVNIVLKKHIDAPTLDVRYGWYSQGGGANRRVSFADSFSVGKWTSLVGVQLDSTQPIWTKDRSITRSVNLNGTGPNVANRDYLVYSPYNNDGVPTSYYFADPNNCSTVAGNWGGTTAKYNRPGRGDYCGSYNSVGPGTLTNSKRAASFYSHNTFDVNDNLQLYGDLLYSYSKKKFANGSNTTWWGTSGVVANSTGGYFWDPSLNGGSLVQLQHSFAPEEVGGYQNIMNKEYENSYMLTLGGKGTFGQSNWDYDLGFTHSDDHLRDLSFQRLASPMEAYYASHVLGAQNGTYSGYPVFTPDYANFYNPVSVADFKSFTGYSNSRSKTWDNLLRGQLTNASLFSLPGGDAGIAMVLEAGNEGWNSSPDPRLLQTVVVDGQTTPYFWGTSATPGAGHRSRAAATVETRLPLLQQLTADISGRYDDYKVGGKSVSAGTYNLGLEYRPFDTLLFRGRYGTAFKAPTLSDEFQRPSNSYGVVNDYLNCARLGFSGSNFGNCPQLYQTAQYKGTTVGNPALKPIKAKVWSYGVVWAPIERMSVSVDYLHWSINNEVSQLSSDTLSNTEYLCDIGTIASTSQTCSAAFAAVTRGPGRTVNGVALLGPITAIEKAKLNVANELVNAITANFSYAHEFGWFGTLALHLSYSDELKHTRQDYVVDPNVDLLSHPYYSTDFKTKANASLTWTRNKWTATVLADRYGRSPNYQASQSDSNVPMPGYELAGRLAPWTLYNASVTYNPLKSLGVSLQVTNLFNKMPPVDKSYPSYISPYNTDNYNPYGRAMYLEANYKFGVAGS